MSVSMIRTGLQSCINDLDTARARAVALLEDLDGSDAMEVPRQGRWTKAPLSQLWDKVRHLPGIVALFAETAAHPGEAVTFSAVTAHSGLSSMQQRNEHARMSRVTAEIFGTKRWPIENWQGPAGPTGHSEMLYRMDPAIAEWWKDLTH